MGTILAHGADAQTKITWITHPAIYGVTGEGKLFTEFTKQTGIEVEVATFPSDTLAQRIPTELISGSDAFDVLTMHEGFWQPDLGKFVEDVDPYLQKDHVPGGLEDFSAGMVRQFRIPQLDSGKPYGIPLRMGVDILYYRKDLFDTYGVSVPKTLDEFYEAAKKLTLDTDNDGKYAEGLVPPGVLSYSYDDAINIMAQAQAAMTMMYSGYWPNLEDPEKSTVAGKIGYAPMPRDPNVADAYFVHGPDRSGILRHD